MGALPRAELPPGAHRDLNDALHDLHHRAGWPSLRRLATATGCSHTTVSKVFSTPRLPAWGTVELIVEAMDGDTHQFHQLWLAASAPQDRKTGRPPPIAGRRAELAAVRRHLESGQGLLLVTGEAGIGKTRLVSAAAALAQPHVMVATGACLPLSSDVPLLPVAEVLRAARRVEDGLWLKQALWDCPAFVPESLKRLLPELDSEQMPADTDDGWSRQRLFAALGSTLAALSEIRPFALVLEDLHWADSMTLDLVEFLAARQEVVSLLGTVRIDDPGVSSSTKEWLNRVRRLQTVQSLELPALTRSETAKQLELLLGRPPAPETAERIHGRSQGHPLFTEQLAADRDDGDDMPRLLVELLDQRLVGLPERAVAVAQALATADRALPEPVLRAATGQPALELTAGLRDLASRHLLGPTNGRDEAALRHPLIAEAIRRRQVPGEGPELHRRMAAALASSASGSPGEIARHWQGAGDSHEELAWRIAAARAAEAVFASAEAAEHWLRVIDLWPEVPTSGAVGSTRLGDAYYGAIDALKTSARLERAAALAEEALAELLDVTAPDAADIYLLASDIGGLARSTEYGLELADKAIAGYRQLPPSRRLIRAMCVRTGHLHDLGRYAEAQATIGTALEVNALVGDLAQQRRLLILQAWCQLAEGHREQSLASAESAAELVVPGDDPFGDIYVGVFHTDLLLLAGAPGTVVEDAGRRGLSAAAAWGIDSENVALLRANIAQALSQSGQVARAARIVEPATEGPVAVEHWALHLERAHVDLLRGQDAAAMTRLDAVSRLPVRSISVRVEIAMDHARADLWRGQPRLALDRLVPILTEAASTDVSARTGPALVFALRAAADQRDTSDSGAMSALSRRLHTLRSEMHVDPLAATAPSADRLALAAQWTAELSRLEGSQTVEQWVAAAAAWDALTRPHDSAYCRWRAAEVALDSGQGTVAARLLRRAVKDAREHQPLTAAIISTRAHSLDPTSG